MENTLITNELQHYGIDPSMLCVSDELRHHGIKGQKWGIRRFQNKDGSLTNAGKKRYKNADGTLTDAEKKQYTDSWSSNWKDVGVCDNPADVFRKSGLSGTEFDKIHESMSKYTDEKLRYAKEAESLLGEFNSGDVRDRCASIAGIATDLLMGYGGTDMESIASTMWFYTCEDGDQGRINSASVYLREKGLVDQAKEIVQKNHEADNNYMRECEKQVSDLLGDYGNNKVTSWEHSDTVAKSIARNMKNHDEKSIDDKTKYSMYKLEEGCDWINDDGEVKNTVDKAKSIVDKIDCSNWNINYIPRAVDNLNLNNVDVNDMTDDQWSALNGEMNRLNKNSGMSHSEEYSNELYHYGIKGQKWGIRRFQNKDGSLTNAGKKHRTLREAVHDHKVNKKRKASLEKAREAKAAKKIAAEEEAKKQQEKAAEKERIIKTGTVSEVLSIKGDLTPQEMSAIQTRMKWENDIKGYDKNNAEAGKSAAEKAFKTMDKVIDNSQTIIKGYNTVANIINAFNGDMVMPKIDTNITSSNKQDVVKRKKDKQKAKEAAEKRAKQEAEGPAKREERAKKKAEKEKQNNKSNDTSKKNSKDNNDSSASNTNKSSGGAHGIKGMKWGKREKSGDSSNNSSSDTSYKSYTERYEATGKDVVGKGTSTFSGWKNSGPTIDAVYDGEKFVNSLIGIEDRGSSSNLPAVIDRK